MSGDWLPGRDAAFASNIGHFDGVVFGYFGGPNAFHVWTPQDWAGYKANPKIPIWVGGLDGPAEGWQALQALYTLGVPSGVGILLDLETRIDKTYVEHFGGILQWAGFKVWPYGSTSSIFANPKLNGYAVADPTGVEHMYPHPGVRITQWSFGPQFDQDVVKEWLLDAGELWV